MKLLGYMFRLAKRLLGLRRRPLLSDRPPPPPNPVRVPKEVAQQCVHLPETGPFVVYLSDYRVFVLPTLACRLCTVAWLEYASRVCATCGLPIVPGDWAAIESVGRVHYPWCCCEEKSIGREFVFGTED